jgi:hypothetical protein
MVLCTIQVTVNSSNVVTVAKDTKELTNDVDVLVPIDIIHTTTILENLAAMPEVTTEVHFAVREYYLTYPFYAQ